ncbi:MAG TPA: hypothetical protein PKI61_03275 [bacterium]|nr:hypothetical protein [bacterium]HPT29786.1 hypothetical protein [bacterium]
MKIKLFSARYLAAFVLSLGFCLLAGAASAAIVPENNKATGSYTLNDMVQTGVNVAQFILGIVGSLTLLMFIYGGFTLLISGGSAESVTKGKKIILGSVIGLVIVFSSYMIIQFAISAIGGGNFTGSVNGTQ